jgi:O-antigen ligase
MHRAIWVIKQPLITTPAITTPASLFPLVYGAALVAAPFSFGAVEAGVQAGLLVVMGFSLIGLTLFHPRPDALSRSLLFTLSLPFTAVLGVLVLQNSIIILPEQAVWSTMREVLGNSTSGTATLEKGTALGVVMPLLLIWLSLIGGWLIGSANRDQAWRFLERLGWAGSLLALYGLVTFLFFPDTLLWLEKRFYRENLTGTFVNRNTAAMFFGLITLLWCALLLARRERMKDKPLQQILRTDSKSLLRALHVVLGLLTVLLTGSRAGTALTILGLSLMVLVFTRHTQKRSWLWLILLAGALVAGAILINERFGEEGITDPARWATWQASLMLIREHPLFGIGLGSFTAGLMPWRLDGMGLRGEWDRAHQAFLEIAATGGLPLAAIVTCSALWLLMRLAWPCLHADKPRSRAVHALAAIGLFLALLQSLIDFALFTPGFAMPLGACIGLALGYTTFDYKRLDQKHSLRS